MKSYKETIGKNSVEFIKNISKIHKSGYELKIAAPYTSLHLSTNYKEIISQHVDYEKPGAHTGSIIMEDLWILDIFLINSTEFFPMVSL